MVRYLYDSNYHYIGEITAYVGMEYPNSTDIKPDFKGKDSDIYRAKFIPALETWEFEYNPEWIQQKAKELDLEIATISTMSEADLRSGKLPELNEMQEAYLEAKSGKKSTKSTKRSK